MIRLALKNLWSQRRVYGWLMLELVILSILAWIIIDPVLVRIYYANQPVGYDSDRLAEIQITSYPSSSPKYSAEAADSATVSENYDRIYSIVESWPGVESATIVKAEFESNGGNSDFYADNDTIAVTWHYYLSNTPFFTTFGLKPVDGRTIQELQKLSSGGADIVISQAVAEGIGKTPREALGYKPNGGDSWRITGVTNSVRPRSVSPANATVFYGANKQYLGVQDFTIVFRLKDGIDPAKFVDENRKALIEKLSMGNYHPRIIWTYSDKSAWFRDSCGYTKSNQIGIFLASFFLINMALGVIGTVWLQTRRRSSEAGVMKAFGARPRHIITTLIWEGVILTTITWITGSTIYLQYALKSGLAQAEYTWVYYPPSWVTDFWVHFGIVALIILALMLIAVVIGIWIPARRIARVDPAVALKDE